MRILILALLGLELTLQAAAPPATVYTCDLRPLNRLELSNSDHAARIWDTLHTFAALQGLANRSAPSLYLCYCSEFGVETDEFWFEWFRGEDGWLKGTEIRPLPDLEAAVKQFRGTFEGLVIYDPAVPATANLASTIAGCERLLPVRHDPRPRTVYDLLANQLKLPIKARLLKADGTSLFTGRGRIPDLDEPSTGSAKTDAYIWALARYLQAGKCSPRMAAYYIDSFWQRAATRAGHTMHTLSNQDYFIARRAFFFDLSPWADEVPNDDPGQPLGTDRAVFLRVLRALYDQAVRDPRAPAIIKIGGFPPWPYKYTSHADRRCKHEGVPTEWEFGRLISQYNAYKEADAAGLGAMANASFYQHYPLATRYAQPNRKPGVAEWRRRGHLEADGRPAGKFYVGHYVGDYDSPSWLYKAVPRFFRDPERGTVPLGWAFNPNLADRAPQALVYARRHAGSNDFFVAGDSGAGYLNPRALTVRPESGLPSGLEAWRTYCAEYYARWDLSISGFILDGSGGRSTELELVAYRTFSPDGAGTHFDAGPMVQAGLATCPERDLPDSVTEAAGVILELAGKRGGEPGFLWARSILKSPAWYAEVSRRVGEQNGEVVFVDPYTFFGLIAR